MVLVLVSALLTAILLPLVASTPPESDSLHYVVTLPDNEMLCYGIQGIPLFPFSLYSSELVSINSYMNMTKSGLVQVSIGAKLINYDQNALRGMNVVRLIVEGNTAYVNDMGGVDVKDKLMIMEMKNNDVEFEVASSQDTEVRLKVYEPSAMVRIIKMAADNSFVVLVENSKLTKNDSVHGIIGQFLNSGVFVDKLNKLLLIPGRSSIPVFQSHVWPELKVEHYNGKPCWKPETGHSVVQGETYDYITDHVAGTKFKFSCSKLK